MDKVINFLYINDLIYFARIIIAVICGFIIGFEREYHKKNAGTRTHVIVALGASLTMILSAYGFKDNTNVDPTRMAAQVISGIGFLGAGLIFVRGGRNITGLTTAAGIWTTAIISMVIGSGKILLGIFCTLLLSLGNLFLSKVKINIDQSVEESIIIEALDDKFKFEDFYIFLDNMNVVILSLDVSRMSNLKLKINANLHLPLKTDKWKFNDQLLQFPGITRVRYN